MTTYNSYNYCSYKYDVTAMQTDKTSYEAELEALTRKEAMCRETLARMTATIHTLSTDGPSEPLNTFITNDYLPMNHTLAGCVAYKDHYSRLLAKLNADMQTPQYQAALAAHTAACREEERKQAQLAEASQMVTLNQVDIRRMIRPIHLGRSECMELPAKIEECAVVSVEIEHKGGRTKTITEYTPGVVVMCADPDTKWIVCQVDPCDGELLFAFKGKRQMRGPLKDPSQMWLQHIYGQIPEGRMLHYPESDEPMIFSEPPYIRRAYPSSAEENMEPFIRNTIGFRCLSKEECEEKPACLEVGSAVTIPIVNTGRGLAMVMYTPGLILQRTVHYDGTEAYVIANIDEDAAGTIVYRIESADGMRGPPKDGRLMVV